MSERKVLNKYYPPDFDPSKIPRARCPRNRQFTVRLMVPCNIKCYTCGEYIAKGKKFNARKEDVENMTYLGVRIYRFYIKCPGCLAEISFRTDPESTDYVIEAGAHRNFQALKLAEEQAAREEREAKEEIESNPMLLLENRTQQSQYEMEVLESLEDLREMNDRHAGIDLGKIAERFETERKMTQEQIEELETQQALKALGYERVEGELIKRINPEELDDDKPLLKKMKADSLVTETKEYKDFTAKPKNGNMKSRLAGMIKKKPSKETTAPVETQEVKQQNTSCNTKETEANTSSKEPTQKTSREAGQTSNTGNIKNSDVIDSKVESAGKSGFTSLSEKCLTSIVRPDTTSAIKQPVKTSGPNALSILGTYSDSDSNESD